MNTLPRRAPVFQSRTKSVEWLMTCIMLGWGITLSYPGDTLSMRVYADFVSLGLTDTSLAVFYLSIGSIRFITIYRNGSMPKGPEIRFVCSGIGAFTWLFTAILFVMPVIKTGAPLPVNFLHHVVFFFGEMYAVGVASLDRRIKRN